MRPVDARVRTSHPRYEGSVVRSRSAACEGRFGAVPARWVVLAAALLLVASAGCEEEQTEYTSALKDGTDHLVSGFGLTSEEQADLVGLSAHLDRTSGLLTLTLPGQAEQVLVFSPRPRDEWHSACWTMSSHSLDEVADLSPGPLVLGSVTLETPLVYAACSPELMVLADSPDGARGLRLDLADD